MSDADKTIADAMAALDDLTVDDLKHIDTETLRRLEALTYHWSEVTASVIQHRVQDIAPDPE